MNLGEIFVDLVGQQDDYTSIQSRARDFKSQAAQLKKELEKTQQDQKAALETAAQRVASLEEELRAARADHQRELETSRVDHQREIESIRSNHQRELVTARKEAVRDYAAGYRYRYRSDFAKNFNGSLLFRVFSAQARRQGLENFVFDPKDFCGFDKHCPAYTPPPVGVFADDGEDPLEAWDVHFPASETGVLPDKRSLLPPRPVAKLAAPAVSPEIRYERTEGNKRRVLYTETSGGVTPNEQVEAPQPDAEMEEAEAEISTPQASAH